MEQRIIAYIEARAATCRAKAEELCAGWDALHYIYEVAALMALARDLRAGLHREGDE